jgi:hypothetical protein
MESMFGPCECKCGKDSELSASNQVGIIDIESFRFAEQNLSKYQHAPGAVDYTSASTINTEEEDSIMSFFKRWEGSKVS